MAYAKEATRQLNMFVASPYFVDVCGAYASAELLAWLANSFFVHSDSLFFFTVRYIECSCYLQYLLPSQAHISLSNFILTLSLIRNRNIV